MPPSIRPIAAHFPVKAWCCSDEIYPHCLAKSKDESVSLFSPSQSVNFTDKMGCVTPLCPCFSKVQADRSRRAPYLTRQSVFFFCWKVLCDLENLHRKFVCELVNIQVLR